MLSQNNFVLTEVIKIIFCAHAVIACGRYINCISMHHFLITHTYQMHKVSRLMIVSREAKKKQVVHDK